MATSVAFKQKALFRAVPGLFSQRSLFSNATPFDDMSVEIQTLNAIVKSYNGSLYLPNVSNFENTTVATGIDDAAELDDPIAYAGDLTTYNLPENMLINSVFAGASVPSTLPTGFSGYTGTSHGITYAITAVGTSSITFSVSGTATSTAGKSFLTSNFVSAKTGELWAAQIAATTEGTLPANKLLLVSNEYDSSYVYKTGSAVNVLGSGAVTKNVRVLTIATSVYAQLHIYLSYTTGDVYDFTVTISNIQLERGRARTYVPTTTAAISRGTFNPAFQATTANKPLLKQDNGKSNWLFDNSNDYLQTPINPTSSGYMCVAARQDDALGSANFLFGAYKTSATVQAGVGLYVSTTGTIKTTRVASDGSQISSETTGAITVGSVFVADSAYTITSSNTRINGASQGTKSATKDSANTGTIFTVGALNTGTSAVPSISNFIGGAIFGAVHIPSVPSDADQATIRKLMAQIAGVSEVV